MKESHTRTELHIPRGCALEDRQFLSIGLIRRPAPPLVQVRPLNRFSIAWPLLLCSGASIQRPSSVGHARGAYRPIIIFGIGSSALQSWKSGCSLM